MAIEMSRTRPSSQLLVVRWQTVRRNFDSPRVFRHPVRPARTESYPSGRVVGYASLWALRKKVTKYAF